MSQEAQRSAIVTGASRGIGKAIALRLVADGFAVTVNYAGSRAAAEAVAALVGPDGRWVSGQNVRVNGGLI